METLLPMTDPMMDIARLLFLLALPVALSFIAADGARAASPTLLNVSYDVSREFYKDYNLAFAAHWKKTTGEAVTLNQSHGGSSRQARSVADGLEADVITMNQHNDIDILHTRGKLVPADWAKRLPHNASPATSVISSPTPARKILGSPKSPRSAADGVKNGVISVCR